MPSRRVRNQIAPPSGARPMRRKIWENRAVWDATTRSQAKAILHPMPTAGPRTAAIVGFSIACRARIRYGRPVASVRGRRASHDHVRPCGRHRRPSKSPAPRRSRQSPGPSRHSAVGRNAPTSSAAFRDRARSTCRVGSGRFSRPHLRRSDQRTLHGLRQDRAADYSACPSDANRRSRPMASPSGQISRRAPSIWPRGARYSRRHTVQNGESSMAEQAPTSEASGGKPRLVGINHVALEVGDIDEALAFYGKIFDFTLRAKRPGNAFIELGDQFINLMQAPGAGRDRRRHFGLVVDNRAQVRDLVTAAGGELLPGPFLDFLDPWGNRVEVVEYRDIQYTKAPHIMRRWGSTRARPTRRCTSWRKRAWRPDRFCDRR